MNMNQSLPLYRFDSDSGEYFKIQKPPRAKKMKLREVEFPYVDEKYQPTDRTYIVIMDETEDADGGKVLCEFEAWVFK